MAKFKVGDKVVVVDARPSGLKGDYYRNGDKGIVSSIEHERHGYVTRDDGVEMNVYWDEVDFEKETEMALTCTMNVEQIRDEILRIDARIEEAKKDIENAENERNSLVEKLREKGFELGGTYSQYIKLGDRVEITGWSKERHEKSHIGRKGIIEKIDNTDIPFKVILDGENEDSNTWFEANQVKKI